jgi:hypothetical protein
MTHLRITAAALAACTLAFAAPAGAQEAGGQGFDEAAMAAINAAYAGRWVAVFEIPNPATGETTSSEVALTFVVTSADGLDTADWSADGMEWQVYQGDGVYTSRAWTSNGGATEHQVQARILEAPDGAGNFAYELVGVMPAPGGGERDTKATISMTDGVMSYVMASRPAGADGDFVEGMTGTFTRAE